MTYIQRFTEEQLQDSIDLDAELTEAMEKIA